MLSRLRVLFENASGGQRLHVARVAHLDAQAQLVEHVCGVVEFLMYYVGNGNRFAVMGVNA